MTATEDRQALRTGSHPPSRARILVTGSRNWADWDVLIQALADARRTYGDDAILMHGACPTGADRMAGFIWGERWGLGYEDHPADWDRYGKAAGPRRNQEMVDLGAAVCLAFPLPDSRGTRHCMAAAERAGIPVHVYEPSADTLEADR